MANRQQAEALTAAITTLTNVVTRMVSSTPATPRTPVHDLYSSPEPFILSTRSGIQVFEKISQPLSEVWDGTIASFPVFVINLRLRANKGKWNALKPQGIDKINDQDIFASYLSISKGQIEQARIAHTDPRAKQISKALYRCLQASISGTVKTTICAQAENIPKHKD